MDLDPAVAFGARGEPLTYHEPHTAHRLTASGVGSYFSFCSPVFTFRGRTESSIHSRLPVIRKGEGSRIGEIGRLGGPLATPGLPAPSSTEANGISASS